MTLPSIYRLLPTEQANPRARDIDLDSALSIVKKINAEDRSVAPAVARESIRMARAIDVLVSAFKNGGKLVFVGAGTSGRLGVLEAAECPPTFGTSPAMIQAVMAGGRSSVFSAKEGAEDDPRNGFKKIAKKVRRGDVVVGIAASGVTPFVHGALEAAGRRGCRTILVTSNEKPSIAEAEIVICPKVGPEVLAGSTRLKSATAAKLVLNTLTTGAMIRLGKVYDRWLVDFKPTSRKLWLRGVRTLCDLGGVRGPEAQRLFNLSGGSVKTAVIAARLKQGSAADRVRKARKLLKASGNSLRRALAEI